MKPQAFAQQVQAIVHNADEQDKLNAQSLNEYQRDRLTAAYMRGLGNKASKVITPKLIEALVGKMIVAFESKGPVDRRDFAEELGEMLLEGAIEASEESINHCIDDAVTELAYKRQFWHDDYTTKQMLAEDNASRARDMNAERKAA